MTDTKAKEVAVIGAGLVGCLTSLAFQKKGYKVTLIELRQDPRDESTTDKNLRSINLAISDRGFKAMRYVDEQLLDKVMAEVIPMHGRMIHDLEGNEESQLYGLYGESINSIDRSFLNKLLLNEMDSVNSNAVNKIDVLFGKKLSDMKFIDDAAVAVEVIDQVTKEKSLLEFDFVIGADGAFSAMRYHLQKKIRMNFTQEYIDTCYIELYIRPGPAGSFSLDPNRLHIWPRHKFMLIALANKDGSFTSTFFAPWALAESLDSREKVVPFFQTHFKDALALIGEEALVNAFSTHPKGALVQIHCDPYNYKGKAILIGDAAHAMVPFYGQGMNCGFESLRVLMEILEKHEFDTDAAFKEYSQVRHEDLEAILKLALDNYHEMSHKVTSALYLMRKRIDGVLSRILKDRWLPLYTMVSFRGDISYSRAVQTERRQQKIIKNLQNVFVIAGIFGSVQLWKFAKIYLSKRK